MKDEIKEILDTMKEISSFEYTTDWFELNYKDTKILLDYITNLQEENKRLNNIINELEKYMNIICMGDATFEERGITQSILKRLKKLKENK